MEAIVLYFGKVIVCSGVMFLYYQLSLKDKTFHHYNRFYLLGAMLTALLLPLVKVEDFTIEVNNDVYMLLDKIQNFNTEKRLDNGNFYFSIIFSALGLVSLYFLGKLTYGIFKIRTFKKQFHKESFDGINFYRTDLTEAPFSYFKNLFWKNTITLDSPAGKQILKHEMVHIEQKHSFDKIFIEIITSVFWFNPFFHIIKKEINLIHEYLADKKAVKHSDTKAFAQMLLASHFSGTQLPATSPFLSSNLKKRLKMLQKPKTKFGYARRIFALPVVFTLAFAYLVNAQNNEIEETNLSLKKAVSEMQKDTVRPAKTEQKDSREPQTINSDHDKKLAEIEKKMDKKGKELDQLKPGSNAFNKKVEEINRLADELGKIASEKAIQETDKYFDSPEWKNQMLALENMEVDVDVPEPDVAPGEIPSVPKAPGAPKSPRITYKNNTVFYKDLSAKEKREVQKAMKEAKKAMEQAKKAMKEGERARKESVKARLEGEKARIESLNALKEGEIARKDNEKVRIENVKEREFFKEDQFNKISNPPKVIVMQADFIKRDGKGNIAMNGIKKFNVSNMDNIKYFIDGREVPQAETQALKPEDIASIHVFKENKTGDRKGEIRIKTKK